VEYVKIASLNIYEENKYREERMTASSGLSRCANTRFVSIMISAVMDLRNERRNFCEILQT
jgi:hypothetical protein